MVDIARRQQLLSCIKDRKKVSVSELAKILYVSEATVRRDLNALEKSHIVRRMHGYAVIVDDGEETSTEVRETKNTKEKELIARIALYKMRPFGTIFFDNSSTALAMVKSMSLNDKIVVTNGIRIADEIEKSSPKTQVYVPTGRVDFSIHAIVGPTTIKSIEDMKYDVCVISCASITEDGVYEFSDMSAAIKKAALSHSSYKILLFDDSKINKHGSFKFADLSCFDLIITNAKDDAIKPFVEKGLNIVNKI